MQHINHLFSIKYLLPLLSAALTAVGCAKEIADVNENVQRMTIKTSSVREGDDIPVEVKLNAAGLTVDNDGWGDPWKKATFSAVIEDAYGHEVTNAVWSGPDGVISNGGKLDLPENGTLNLVLSSLRQGEYSVKINLETRYTVDTWASGWVKVLPPTFDYRTVLVKDFTIPDERDGVEVDESGNIILDLRIFNERRPFRYFSSVSPGNATNKRLTASSNDETVLRAGVDNGNVIVLVPKRVGVTEVNAASEDGGAKKIFTVKVIETSPDANGFTIPTDNDGGDPDAIFDVAGRLALDINEYGADDYYEYVCRPIPSYANEPVLTASSDKPEIADAKIMNGNHLRIYPKSVGYANVTISKSDGSIKRVLRVAVISVGEMVLRAREQQPSGEDSVSGVFPCEIVFSSTTQHLPGGMFVDVYGKAIARADLSDPADHFVDESIKNSRSAFVEFEENTFVGYSARYGDSIYDVYDRLMMNVAGVKFLVHHSDDWPNYRDYYLPAKLYKVILSFNLRRNYDTNLYRIELREDYDNPENKLYQYL